MLEVENLKKSYHGQTILQGLEFTVAAGEMMGVIGPNGSGKTTLVRLLSDETEPDEGEVYLDGRPISQWSGRQRALRLAVLPQEGLPAVPFTVEEVIATGRHPHQGWWPWSGRMDQKVIERVMKQTGLLSKRDRRIDQLSGGERQLVALAKAMVQEPNVLILDEPTTYLDIAHQVAVLDQIQQWRRQEELAVLVVLHDLNLASQYCDRLLLIKEGVQVAEGTPTEVLTAERIHDVYGIIPQIIRHPVTQLPQVLLCPSEHGTSLESVSLSYGILR